jgi:hypothetical protein
LYIKINYEVIIYLFRYNVFVIVLINLNKGNKMAKGKDSQKEVKKKSEKSLKEKRNDKKEKKSTFLSK